MYRRNLLFVLLLMLLFSISNAESRGHFIANAVKAVGSGNDRTNIYDKLAIVSYERHKQINDIWVQAKYGNFRLGGNKNSKGDFEDNIGGFNFGYGRELKKNISMGLFGKYDSHSVSQEKSSAYVNSYGIGAHGGYLYEEFDFKGIVSFSGQQYCVMRDAGIYGKGRSDFNGYDINADLEAAYWFETPHMINIRPYAGLNLGYTGYGSSSEIGAGTANLKTDSGSFSRNAFRLGTGVNGKYEKIGWYGGLECEYILSGRYAKIKSKTSGTNAKIKSAGAETNAAVLGINAGGDYDISSDLKAYANLVYKVTGGLSDFSGSVGAVFVFDSF